MLEHLSQGGSICMITRNAVSGWGYLEEHL